MAIQWKAGLLGAASGIALAHAMSTVFMPLFTSAIGMSSNPLAAVKASLAVNLIYANLALSLLSAGIGGFVGARLAKSHPVLHGLLSASIQALLYLAGLAFAPFISFGSFVVAALTAASGAAGGYVASRRLKTVVTDSLDEKRSNL